MATALIDPGLQAPVRREAGVAGIASVAAALPPHRVTNAEIAERIGVSPEWIVERTGIHERRHARGGSLTALAAEAGRKALDAAGVDGADVELVLVATFTQDELLPNAAPLVAGELGARGAAACDIGAACTGFMAALSLGAAQVESGRVANALIIGADLLHRVTDSTDRKTAALFADGAGAAFISRRRPRPDRENDRSLRRRRGQRDRRLQRGAQDPHAGPRRLPQAAVGCLERTSRSSCWRPRA